MSTGNDTAPDVPAQHSFYNYPGPPTRWVCYIFVILFSLSFVWHVFQTFRYRLWSMIATVDLAAFGEVAGWIGRLWSSYDPNLKKPFMIQIVSLVIAPTPFIAAIFTTFSRLTQRMGVQYTRVPSRWYSRIFLTCDIISLLIQTGGASIVAGTDDPSKTKLGSNIMLTGIIFQLFSISVFVLLVAEYLFRFYYDFPLKKEVAVSNDFTGKSKRNWNPNLKLLTAGLLLIIACIYARSVYRTMELAEGANGAIQREEVLFNVLDGAMLAVSLLTFNICHPGRLLAPDASFPTRMDSVDNISLVVSPHYRS